MKFFITLFKDSNDQTYNLLSLELNGEYYAFDEDYNEWFLWYQSEDAVDNFHIIYLNEIDLILRNLTDKNKILKLIEEVKERASCNI